MALTKRSNLFQIVFFIIIGYIFIGYLFQIENTFAYLNVVEWRSHHLLFILQDTDEDVLVE